MTIRDCLERSYFDEVGDAGESGAGGGGGDSGGASSVTGSSGGGGEEYYSVIGRGDASASASEPSGQSGQTDSPADGAAPGAEKSAAEPQKEYEDKDYLEAVRKDTELLGDDPNVGLDAGLVKGMAPLFRECGISPETANKLANGLARLQFEEAREVRERQLARSKEAEARIAREFTRNDLSDIDAVRRKYCREGSVLDNCLRYSEFGNDPELLRMMRALARHEKVDSVAGGASGGGESGSGNGFGGLSKLW